MPKRLTLAAAAMVVATSTAQAVVISDTQLHLRATSEFEADYAITAIQDPEFDDPTTLWFTKLDGVTQSRLTPVTWNVDQEADYYLAAAGDQFTPENIAAGQFRPLFTLDQPHVLEVPFNGEFYLAVATSGPGPIPGGVPQTGFGRNVWGWAHFRNDASGLTLLSSAMAYREAGIIVGTTTPVPEPSTWLLSVMGLAGISLRLRRRQTMSR